MSDVPPVGAPQTAGEGGREHKGLTARLRQPKVLIGLLTVVLVAWFILANNTETRIHFWVVWVTAKLWIAFVVTFAAGLVVGYLIKRRAGAKE